MVFDHIDGLPQGAMKAVYYDNEKGKPSKDSICHFCAETMHYSVGYVDGKRALATLPQVSAIHP